MASKEERELKRLAELDAQMRVKVQELQGIDSLIAESKSRLAVTEKQEQQAVDRIKSHVQKIEEHEDKITRTTHYLKGVALKDSNLSAKIQQSEMLIASQKVAITEFNNSIKEKTIASLEADATLRHARALVTFENSSLDALHEKIRLLELDVQQAEQNLKDMVVEKERVQGEIEQAISNFRLYEQRISALEEETGYTVTKPKL